MATKTKPKAPSAEEVARSTIEAFKARDFDTVAANWSEEGIEDLVPLGILRGRDEILENARAMYAVSPDLEVTVESIVADERRAAVQWRGRGTVTGGRFT